MKFNVKTLFNPQVRMFLYGMVAAILAVATSNNWITDDLAKSIQENLPTILGSFGAILAAANVSFGAKVEKPVEETPVVSPAPVVTPEALGYTPEGAVVLEAK